MSTVIFLFGFYLQTSKFSVCPIMILQKKKTKPRNGTKRTTTDNERKLINSYTLKIIVSVHVVFKYFHFEKDALTYRSYKLKQKEKIVKALTPLR